MYRLKNNVYACIDQGCLVFLDSKNYRYFQLNEKDTAELLNCEIEKTKFNKLIEKQIIEYDKENKLKTIVKKERELLLNSILSNTYAAKRQVNFGNIVKVVFINTVNKARIKFLKSPFPKFRNKSTFSKVDDNKIAEVIGTYNACIVFLPWSKVDECLFQSISLKQFLMLHGIDSELVIGVKTKPFRAHAWLEKDRKILNDELQHIEKYKPIMVVK
ncbi:lasso peptide biosynthesis B2 protein [Acinetobacter baumannii]|nr:lasso peptide biosynthesis B2 protein [Acinetobacter baumannii]